MNKKFIPVVSNVDKISKGLKVQDHEISVAVLASELHLEEPKFYASRTGRLYDPSTGFNTVEGFSGNKLPDKLHEEFFSLLSDARKALPLLKEAIASIQKEGKQGETMESQKLKVELKRKDEQIKELLEKGPKNDEMARLKAQLQAQTLELEKLKASQKQDVKHHKFNKVVKLLKLRFHVYLYGPAGTGKSNMAEQIADHMGLDFYPMSTITQEFKFTGYKDGNGLYHDTNFYKAVKHGGLYFIDELDSCSSDVIVGLNGCLANNYFDFPNETIKVHKDFYVVSAGNTAGRGATSEYVARQELDLSTLDRFMTVKIDYDVNIDMAVAKNDKELVEFAHAIRKASVETEINILMSYRAINAIAKLKNDEDFSLAEIIEMAVLKGLPTDDTEIIRRRLDISPSNKYYKALKEVA